VQRTLRRLDYRPGPIDGLFGPRTERAVVRFQRAEALPTDGIVGAQTLDRLHERAGERRPVASRPKSGPRSSDGPSVTPSPGTSPAPAPSAAPAEPGDPGRGGIVLGALLGLLVALLVSAGAVAAVPGRSRKRSEAVAPAFELPAGHAPIVKRAGAEQGAGRQASASLTEDALASERTGSAVEPPLCDDPTLAELLRCVYAEFFEDQVARELREEAPERSSWNRFHPLSASARDRAVAPLPPALKNGDGEAKRRSRIRLRRLPLTSRAKSLAAGVMSLLAVLLVGLYLVAPPVGGSCDVSCVPGATVQLAYNVAACAVLAITAYFVCLCGVGIWVTRRPPRRSASEPPFYVLVVPARNEELVIEVTARRLLDLEYGRFLVLVMNDGSDDDTSVVARSAGRGDRRLLVVDRPPEIAGTGKGEVLNHAYRVARDLVEDGDPRMQGARSDEVVLCVVDADGWLQPNALDAVAPFYNDPRVAGVQVPVRMYNARAGFLAFMQDIEFIGYSLLVQGGRDPVGSVGLGGNGQFIRLAALQSLGEAPWTKSLVEDLDIGLTLVKQGWRNRLCPHTHVAQQAVTAPRRLLRQRTRWVQGHYTCWNHLPSLWRARSVPLFTRLDLSLHLFLAVAILLGTTQLVLGLFGYLGIYPIRSTVLAHLLAADLLYRTLVVILACGPLALLSIAYQRSAVRFQGSPELRLPLWALPGMLLMYTMYTYFWGVPSSLRAFGRIALRRDGWAKTSRDPIAIATSEAPAS
jgi:1,2-diacylglycerol 3-beta-glucosyltransferase